MGITKKAISICLFVVFALSMTGCNVQYTGNPDNTSTSCANITMGNGKFAYCGDFIYFTDYLNIYEYDTETGITVVLDSKSEDVRNIYIQDEYVYFSSEGLKRIRKDGKKVQQMFEREGGCLQLYIEDKNAFYLDSIEGSLYHRDIQDGTETELMKRVLSYFVDEEDIYVVAKEEETPYLYVAEKNNMKFTKQEFSFEPIGVLSKDGSLYMTERGSYQLIKYSQGNEERLPVYGVYFQVVGDKVIYMDSNTYQNGCFDLVVYNMQLGESTTVYQGVYDFCVLGNEYIGIQYQPVQSAEYYLYNLETNEVSQMK